MGIVFLLLVGIAIVLLTVRAMSRRNQGKDKRSSEPSMPPPPSYILRETAAAKVTEAPPKKASGKPASAGSTASARSAVQEPPKKQEIIPPHPDGEYVSFDIAAKKNPSVWICPACGAENTDGTRCQVCGGYRG